MCFNIKKIYFHKMAIEAFKITNPTKQFYIDFIYGALLKMKEYDAHTSLEAYRKLMEIFPVGTIIDLNNKYVY